jgi:hypothetical protein
VAISIHKTDSFRGLAPAHPRPVAKPFAPPHRLDQTLAGMREWPLRSYLELRAVPEWVRIARSRPQEAGATV